MYQTEETVAGLHALNDTSAKCLEAVKKITPAEEEPPGNALAGSIFRQLEDDSGRQYYYNPQTGESQWEHPLKQNKLAMLVAPRISESENAFASAALKVLGSPQKPVRPPETG